LEILLVVTIRKLFFWVICGFKIPRSCLGISEIDRYNHWKRKMAKIPILYMKRRIQPNRLMNQRWKTKSKFSYWNRLFGLMDQSPTSDLTKLPKNQAQNGDSVHQGILAELYGKRPTTVGNFRKSTILKKNRRVRFSHRRRQLMRNGISYQRSWWCERSYSHVGGSGIHYARSQVFRGGNRRFECEIGDFFVNIALKGCETNAVGWV